ncbi:P-loop containing nucleoside triphosphate hydrolase protein [Xylariaceae sp. FL0804]|nr:P-loop containing nucleoside triphosphate hydrolase protein [Xylariaceae sp. FL0804]
MYSRYIPSQQAPKEPEVVQPQVAPAPKPQATAYARYIPPPKAAVANAASGASSASQHIRFDGVDDPQYAEPPAKRIRLSPEAAPEDSKGVSKKSKEKKKKKEPKPTPSDQLEPDEEPSSLQPPVEESSSNPSDLAPSNIPVVTQESLEDTKEQSSIVEAPEVVKKSKREKKEKSKKHVSDSVDAVEDDAPKKGHKAVLERAAKSIRPAPDSGPADGDTSMTDQVELHGLEPLPQPKPVAPDTSKVAYETLPSWLAEPIRVSASATAPFTDLGSSPELGISSGVAEKLATKGYSQAFAIQTAAIPLLLPHHCKTRQGDLLVSAATGSGKTLAYTLPMMRDLSRGNRRLTRLRALIVVPTRELVRQVHEVCEQCAHVLSLDGENRRPRIAMAMGNRSLEQEQISLVERFERFDPKAYARRADSEEEDEGYNTDDEERAAIRKRERQIPTLPDHVIDYRSKVDVLVCTPGRLVDHIKCTPGFSLDFVRWLVVDEADKLLGQSFQQWLDVVIPRLQTNAVLGARNHKQSNLAGVRKIVLSATMTRDLDQLEGLKLREPKLLVLEGLGASQEISEGNDGTPAEHALPALLQESALKVSDPNLKPLFLVDLLRSSHILGATTTDDASDDDETSSSGSDSDDSDAKAPPPKERQPPLPTVLIFTKSNEAALRLSRLVSLLAPAYGRVLGTLASTTPYATRRDTMRAFRAGRLRVLVASDLVARGIDLPALDHVVNYDVPSSVASYVHRVGRTARAGRPGRAWTLFTNPEGRWFWTEVAGRGGTIRRAGDVERVRVTEERDEAAFGRKVEAYEKALEQLGEEASRGRRK